MAVYQVPGQFKGLNDEEVNVSRKRFGYNRMEVTNQNSFLEICMDILKEPMLILLFTISIIYLIAGEYGEAGFMFLAIIAVSAISIYQNNRSKKALEELEKLNEPLSTVIRNSETVRIPTHEIVVGDLCVTEEGRMINADGKIIHSNDFSVNESSLTGESYSVFRNSDPGNNEIFSGTIAVSGLAVFEVERIGPQTRIGRIGDSILTIKHESSPLQIQITSFVKRMAVAGVVVFLLVWAFNFIESGTLIGSLLNGLTMAMSVLPEEIPVAFTTFMALGAWKLMREGIIIKRSSIVETLGSTTVICTDKTGTITENSMHLKLLYDYSTDLVYEETEFEAPVLETLIDYAMWSSEPVPFDPMEKTLHKVYEQTRKKDSRSAYRMVHEYPLEGKPPMMTHIFERDDKQRIVAAKGAPEAILAVVALPEDEKNKVRNLVKNFGMEGYRVLGVANSDYDGSSFPEKQQDIKFQFLGLVVFLDPPKKGIRAVFNRIYEAGIRVKVITGDNADTTASIAAMAGIENTTRILSGSDIGNYDEKELMNVADDTVLFTRMFPEAKLKVVNALKKKGEIVAMLGDGVNDGPALKAAHIGVAMGNKGTEIAKAAASLVITDDDLGKLVLAIAAGRRIYANIKKAIQYIISIHIPIILTVSLPLFLGWKFPQIFTPVHVIFLELVMGPTCSIVYENEPMEKNTMQKPPRIMKDTFLNFRELAISILQGLLITAGVLFSYQWAVHEGSSEEKTRAIVFATLIFGNIFLSLTNRSFYYSVFSSFKNKNRLFPLIIGVTLVLLFAILYFKPLSRFFHVTGLTPAEFGISASIAALSVLWFELYKMYKRSTKSTRRPVIHAYDVQAN